MLANVCLDASDQGVPLAIEWVNETDEADGRRNRAQQGGRTVLCVVRTGNVVWNDSPLRQRIMRTQSACVLNIRKRIIKPFVLEVVIVPQGMSDRGYLSRTFLLCRLVHRFVGGLSLYEILDSFIGSLVTQTSNTD